MRKESQRILDLSKKIEKRFIVELKKIKLDSLFEGLPAEYLYGQERLAGSAMAPVYAEILGLKDDKKIIDLGVASLFGRCYVILLDQIIDKHRPITDEQIAALGPMNHFFTSKILRLVNNEELNEKIDEITMKNMRGSFKNYAKGNLKNIALKIKVIEIPVMAACYLAGKPKLRDKMGNVAKNLSVALQLVDDISDTEKDFREGNNTMPVVEGLIENGKLSQEKFEWLMNETIKYTVRSRNTIKKVNKTAYVALNYFDGLIENMIKAKNGVKSVDDLKRLDCYPLQKDLLRKPIR